ncbi:MAG: replicative DNA helicase [Armatimonadetes bacterium]|nr:replicative DNA helicase [Armatimonadota bacterium]
MSCAPASLEAEQSTLGSMMIDRGALEKGVDILNPEDFYRDAHQIIFDSLVSLAERNEPVDIVTTQEELRTRKRLEEVGGTEYLMALIDSVPTAANIEYYARIVEEKAILRRLIDACTQIMSLSHGAVEDVDALVDRCERMIFQVSQKRMGQYFTQLDVLAHQAFEKIEVQYREKLAVSGLATGFRDLDNITSGLQPSDLVIVAARPSMGKTAMCLDIARHVAIHQKKPVAIFSLEMAKEQLALRLICSESRVDSHRLRTGYVQDKEWPLLAEGVGRLYAAPIYVDDSTEVSPLQMRGKCRRLKAEQGLSLVIVDYLQLIQSHRRAENRNQEISEIARSLKGLARELEVPVIALSQLSRAVEQRQDRRPILSDLRESGSIEAEADVVVFLYREAYYKRREIILDEDGSIDLAAAQDAANADNTAEIIIGKQRNGPTGTVRLAFLQKFACFENLEQHRTEE